MLRLVCVMIFAFTTKRQKIIDLKSASNALAFLQANGIATRPEPGEKNAMRGELNTVREKLKLVELRLKINKLQLGELPALCSIRILTKNRESSAANFLIFKLADEFSLGSLFGMIDVYAHKRC